MYELIILALIFTIFAVVQDFKTREVANWLNFSLIAFALAFRLFYSIMHNEFQFFYLGLMGLVLFTILANLFYYTRAFAGGDAKLLMGFGIILPYSSYSDILPKTLVFIFLLFLSGAIYSLIYSIFIAIKNKTKFKTEFKKNTNKNLKLLTITPILFVLALFFLHHNNYINNLTVSAITILFIGVPWIWIYTHSLDKCMSKIYSPDKLMEGDWLDKDVKHKGKTLVKKTVHGLSLNEIKLIQRHNLKVQIKEGIPFTPAFLISLIIKVFFSEVLTHYLQTFLYLLF